MKNPRRVRGCLLVALALLLIAVPTGWSFPLRPDVLVSTNKILQAFTSTATSTTTISKGIRHPSVSLKCTRLFARKDQSDHTKSTSSRLGIHVASGALAVLLTVGTLFGGNGALAAAAEQETATDPSSSSSFTTTTTTTIAQDPHIGQARSSTNARRYWNIMAAPDTTEEARALKIQANEGLFDCAVGTITTMYYDNSGGAFFTPREFYSRWREFRDANREQSQPQSAQMMTSGSSSKSKPRPFQPPMATYALATREGAVTNLKWLVSTLNDPYSKYLTREEMWAELHTRNDGFLGLGAMVEAPEEGDRFFARGSTPTLAVILPDKDHDAAKRSASPVLDAVQVQNLPVVTAVVPDSPAERSGITVGDRVVAVGDFTFLHKSRDEVSHVFATRFSTGTNYFGYPELTVAKPVVRNLKPIVGPQQLGQEGQTILASMESTGESAVYGDREVVIGYRPTRVRLPTMSLDPENGFQAQQTELRPQQPTPSTSDQVGQFVAASMLATTSPTSRSVPMASTSAGKGGNAIVHWELLTSDQSSSIFRRAQFSSPLTGDDAIPTLASASSSPSMMRDSHQQVGYIRLTRFSKASTAGFVEAVNSLEQAGATSFIIDVRNNYGGVIQEAMLTASSLLRDSHSVLCYTLNSRGGFTPHDVEEFAVDKRYPGYLMSKEGKSVTVDQAKRENPAFWDEGGAKWVPPSSFASLHEQISKRGIKRVSAMHDEADDTQWASHNRNKQLNLKKKLVILVNEGTASAAEVFAAALHDNGRTVALVGTKTFGKGLIQHTFPMPDGGGLRLTVAEYLTPALHHVTNVGGAKFDRMTGEQVGGGIRPDVICDASRQGIPSNIGADLCVGIALDVLEEAESSSSMMQKPRLASDDDGNVRRATGHHSAQKIGGSGSIKDNGTPHGPIQVAKVD